MITEGSQVSDQGQVWAAPARIDINVDLGESFGHWRLGNDAEIMPYIQTINVACGFHAGDPVTMAATVRLAKQHELAVGAHPGFPDLLGFGRRRLQLSPNEAHAYVLYQIGGLREILAVHGLELHHIKTHGALDDTLYEDGELAEAVAEAVAESGVSLLYRAFLPGHDPFAAAVEARNVEVVYELYPDLEYSADGMPQPIREVGEQSASSIAAQTEMYLRTGHVRATTGEAVPVRASSICIHGDGPHAVEAARLVSSTVRSYGITLAAATRDPSAGRGAQ